MSDGTPAAETPIDRPLVRRLLEDQHPDLAILPLGSETGGWDNVVYRLGDELAVRLPRRRIAVQLARNEQRWLGAIAERLPVAVPEVERIGRPGRGFPWPWSIVRWVEGAPLDEDLLGPDEAPRWGRILATLHRPADSDAPVNPYRGQRLRPGITEDRLARLPIGRATRTVLCDAVERAALAELPAPCWIHGDLHPRNILAVSGRITGIIDWGDLTAGDPATDLASTWILFESSERMTALTAYGGLDEAATARMVGWAVHLGAMLATIADDRRHGAAGTATLRRVIDHLEDR